ncbi:MAG: dependent oxidoreductase, partial [Paenibacillus sp.]|nr:dependent oxidoreductase [Paenibacillus sp.]
MTAKETKYDIVIVGAGVGGICAALAAARLRRSVLLV